MGKSDLRQIIIRTRTYSTNLGVLDDPPRIFGQSGTAVQYFAIQLEFRCGL